MIETDILVIMDKIDILNNNVGFILNSLRLIIGAGLILIVIFCLWYTFKSFFRF